MTLTIGIDFALKVWYLIGTKEVTHMNEIKMLQNLHTHCTHCDGRNTPREMIERAISLGFTSLGFSSHANTRFGDSCELRIDPYAYANDINGLKAEYADRIKIYLGTELDYYSAGIMPDGLFDYQIASVHYAMKNGEKICYDYSIEHSRDAIDRLFDGDGLKYAAAYYENMADLPRQLKGDFVGHFDLLTKYEVKAPDLFDTGSPEYRKMALEALVAVREGFEFFEVNTGPIGRGYKPTPYPAPFILDEMRAQGCKLIITTDCHNKDYLDCGFSEAIELVRAHGFTEIYELTDSGFTGRKI